MAEIDPELLRLLVRLRNLGDEAFKNLETFLRERPDTIDDIIRMGRQDREAVDNIIMLGKVSKTTLQIMIRKATDEETADRWRKLRWQILGKWSILIGLLITVSGIIPNIPSIVGFFSSLMNWVLKRGPQ